MYTNIICIVYFFKNFKFSYASLLLYLFYMKMNGKNQEVRKVIESIYQLNIII